MLQTIERPRTKAERMEQILRLSTGMLDVQRELNDRSLYEFMRYFWSVVSPHTFKDNWHIYLICDEVQHVLERVARHLSKEYDLIINIPPGMTKTITISIMSTVWAWTRWEWMRYICASYSQALSLESAEYARDLIRSEEFRRMYPELAVKDDKDTKSNFKVVKKIWERPNRVPRLIQGGNRFSTSVGGTMIGFHGDVLFVDDPLNPQQAASEKELATANRWIDQTLPTRKTDKSVTPTILIMQRLHQDDPTGHILAKGKKNVRHICLPGEIRNYREQLKPQELAGKYKDDLLDPVRMPWGVLEELEADLGQYGYAGQVGQDPTPPGGGMFKVDHFRVIEELPSKVNFLRTVRYWDKAATAGAGAYTVGVKMSQLTDQRWVVHDVVRGQWATDERERIIQSTAQADGGDVKQYVEQEPGSGGKDSAQATMTELSLQGSASGADRPTGDKTLRADTFSVQVNRGRVWLLRGEWNAKYIDEFRYFPHGTYKDQVDASSGAFKILSGVKRAGMLGGGKR